MSDLLPQIPPPRKAPEKPKSPNQPVDDFAEGFLGTLIIGSQLMSKKAPVFARKVMENVLGPEVALRSRPVAHYTLPKASLLIGPAPVGFVAPENYGLPPNWLYGFNKFVTYDFPTLGFLKLPESSYLHTLPDSHPATAFANWEESAREQRRQVEKLTQKATIEQVLQLYAIAKGPNADKVFYKPDEIVNSLEVTVRIRVGFDQGNKLLEASLLPPVPAPIPPGPVAAPVATPGALLPVLPEGGTTGPSYTTTGDLLAAISAQGTQRPKDAPPSSTLQQAALKLAPELLRDLITERVDP